MDKNLEEDILSILYATHKDEKMDIDEWEIARCLEQDVKKIHSTCIELQIREYVESRNLNQTKWLLTKKGVKALDTIYNPEWVKQQETEKQEEKDLRKWSKIGTKAAIVIGSSGLILSIVALAVALQK